MINDIVRLGLAGLAQHLRARTISPVDVVDACIAHIEAHDGAVNAFVSRTFDAARAQARRAEAEIVAGHLRGPLHGIPFGLKDVYDTKGVATTGHSRVCADRVPGADAAALERLRRAGAILLGKLASWEFAIGGPSLDLPWPPARNPWDLACSPGGSSSGSAAAIAAGMLPLALGTDAGGSLRMPASACGITALMPTQGLVSRTGVIPNCFALDRCGPMATTAEDCALALQVIAAYDPHDSDSVARRVPDYAGALRQDLAGLRIGVLRWHWEEDQPSSDAARRAMEASLDVLRELGAELHDCRMPWPMAEPWRAKIVLASCDLLAIHRTDLASRPEAFGASFRSRVLPGTLLSGSDYVAASREHRRYGEEIAPLNARFDALVTVGDGGEAKPFSAHRAVDFFRHPSRFTAWNVTGQPVLSVCNGFGPRGLPLGMQIIGRPFDEATLLRVGHAYECSTQWHRRRPSLAAGAVAPTLRIDDAPPPLAAADPKVVNLCEDALARTGLKPTQRQLAEMVEMAPYALEIAARLRRDHGYGASPALGVALPKRWKARRRKSQAR